MKKVILLIICLFIITGCTKNNKFNEENVYTTIYPLEYATSYLYSDYANIKSIYPNEVNIKKYKLTSKQKKLYSEGKTFIYNGLTNEVKIAVDFLNNNDELQIIDGMKNMKYEYGIEELWLDPAYYLMIARNIKESLIDYEKNAINKEKIKEKYDKLKIFISEIDVELTMVGRNAKSNTLIVANNSLEYLNKYNIKVYSIDPSNENYEKNISETKKLAKDKKIMYIYKLNDTKLNEEITNLSKTYNLEIINIHSLKNLTEEEKKNNENYLTLMNKNIEELKKELLK